MPDEKDDAELSEIAPDLEELSEAARKYALSSAESAADLVDGQSSDNKSSNTWLQEEHRLAEEARMIRMKELYFTLDSRGAKRILELERIQIFRINRHRLLKIAVVFLMLSSLILSTTLGGINFGLNRVISEYTPIVIGFAILFNIVESYLRDYEVALHASNEIVRITGIRDKTMIDMEIAEDSVSMVATIRELMNGINSNSIVSAEAMPPISAIIKLITKYNEKGDQK